jgi:hypothetical protein
MTESNVGIPELPSSIQALDGELQLRAVEVWHAAHRLVPACEAWLAWFRELRETGDADPTMARCHSETVGRSVNVISSNTRPEIDTQILETASRLPKLPTGLLAGPRPEFNEATGDIVVEDYCGWQKDPELLNSHHGFPNSGCDALHELVGLARHVIRNLTEYPVTTLDRELPVIKIESPAGAVVMDSVQEPVARATGESVDLAKETPAARPATEYNSPAGSRNVSESQPIDAIEIKVGVKIAEFRWGDELRQSESVTGARRLARLVTEPSHKVSVAELLRIGNPVDANTRFRSDVDAFEAGELSARNVYAGKKRESFFEDHENAAREEIDGMRERRDEARMNGDSATETELQSQIDAALSKPRTELNKDGRNVKKTLDRVIESLEQQGSDNRLFKYFDDTIDRNHGEHEFEFRPKFEVQIIVSHI